MRSSKLAAGAAEIDASTSEASMTIPMRSGSIRSIR